MVESLGKDETLLHCFYVYQLFRKLLFLQKVVIWDTKTAKQKNQTSVEVALSERAAPNDIKGDVF